MDQPLTVLIIYCNAQFIILILFGVKVRTMRKQEQLRYETEHVDMTTTTLESMFNNLGEKVKNMSVKIQFVNERQKQAFLMSEERIKEMDDAVSLISDDSDDREPNVSNSQKNVTTFVRPKDKKSKGIVRQTRVIEVPFERSILLKEKYSSKLQKIERRLNVQFIIVPNKVKIYGMKSDLLDQAFEEFGVIQDQINLVPISDYGKQVYQSKYFKELLRENKVQIIKILDKQYFWFEEGIPNPKDLIKEIFVDTTHRLFYLGNSNKSNRRQKNGKAIKLAHGQFTCLNQNNSIINDLTIKIEGTIFQKYVENGLNRLEKRDNRKVELSEDRQSILLHLDTIQQVFIQQSNIRSLYEPFNYVYLVFSKMINQAYLEQFLNAYRSVSSVESFRKKKNQVNSLFFTQRIQNYVVISYFQDVNKIVQTENQQLYLEQHQLMQFLKKIPQELLDFRLVIKGMLDNPQEEGELKKFVFEKDPVEKLTYVSCKNLRRKNYQLLIALYIQKKIQQNFKKEENISKVQVSKSISMDLSRPVDQTSIMINATMNNSSFSILNGVNVSNIVSGNQKILPPDIVNTSQVSAFRFEDYSFCVMQKPEERDKKYSEEFKITKKKQSTLKNLQLQKAINNASSSKFKIWGINVPLQFKEISLENQVQILMAQHPQLQKYNKWVTVFYGGKQAKDSELIYAEDQKLKIQKIDTKSKFKQGYLLKTNLMFLYLQNLENGSTELPFGKYEALYYVKRLQK